MCSALHLPGLLDSLVLTVMQQNKLLSILFIATLYNLQELLLPNKKPCLKAVIDDKLLSPTCGVS